MFVPGLLCRSGFKSSVTYPFTQCSFSTSNRPPRVVVPTLNAWTLSSSVLFFVVFDMGVFTLPRSVAGCLSPLIPTPSSTLDPSTRVDSGPSPDGDRTT